MFDPLRRYRDITDEIHQEPFKEYLWLVLQGKFLEPPQLKEQEIKINLAPDIHLNRAEINKYLDLYTEDPPKAVGFLEKEKSGNRCHVSFPEDAMQFILAAALANKIKFINLYGEKMRYRQASIFNFSLTEKPEDYE